MPLALPRAGGQAPSATRLYVDGVPRVVIARVAFVLALATLLAGCTGSGTDSNVEQKERLAVLRQQANLDPCPPALTTDLPTMTLSCIGDGKAMPVHGAPGRPILVNFYNTPCGPCQAEFPLLVRYQATRPTVGLVGVDAQDTSTHELAFVRDFKATWSVVSDPQGRLFRKYAGGWPVTIAVAADGTRTGVHAGKFKTLADVESLARTTSR